MAKGEMAEPDVKAMVFDTFGTVVDWRSSIIAECKALAVSKGLSFDPEAFADAWRAGYHPAMDREGREVAPDPVPFRPATGW